MADEQEITKSKPKRNPVERIIVWGGIGIMLLVVATEGLARFGYSTSLNRIQAAMDAEDDAADSEGLTLEKAESMMLGFPSRSEEGNTVTYRFKGLIKDFGGIKLLVSNDGVDVLGFQTDNPEEEEKPAPVAYDDSLDQEYQEYAQYMEYMDEMEGIGGGDSQNGDGEPRGRGGFDPMQFDTDGDGKLTIEEVPERMQQGFGEIDTNGDGFADAEELEARLAARRAEGGRRGRRGGEGGGERNRPARPEIEEDSAAESEESSTEEN